MLLACITVDETGDDEKTDARFIPPYVPSLDAIMPYAEIFIALQRTEYAQRMAAKEKMIKVCADGKPLSEADMNGLDGFVRRQYGPAVLGEGTPSIETVLENARWYFADQIYNAMATFSYRQWPVWELAGIDGPAPEYRVMLRKDRFTDEVLHELTVFNPGDKEAERRFYAGLAQDFSDWTIAHPEGFEFCTFKQSMPGGLSLVPKKEPLLKEREELAAEHARYEREKNADEQKKNS